jgi:hypothetical protein
MRSSSSRLSSSFTSAPLSTGFRISTKPIRFVSDDGMSATVSGTEYLGPVTVGNSNVSGDIVISYLLNPTRVLSRLSAIASTYERFMYKSLKIHYAPIVPATQAGSIVMCLELDPDDVTGDSPDNIRTFLNNMNNMAFQVSQPASYTCHLDLKIPYLYCEHSGHADVDIEPRTYLQGVVLGAFNGSAPASDTVMGSLFAEYTIEFRDPQLTVALAPADERVERKPTSLPVTLTASTYTQEPAVPGPSKGTFNEYHPFNDLAEGVRVAEGVIKTINTVLGPENAIDIEPLRGFQAIVNMTAAIENSVAHELYTNKLGVPSYPDTIPGCYYLAFYVLTPSTLDNDYWPYLGTGEVRVVNGYNTTAVSKYIGNVDMTGSILSTRPARITGSQSWQTIGNYAAGAGSSPSFTPSGADVFSDATPCVGQNVVTLGCDVSVDSTTTVIDYIDGTTTHRHKLGSSEHIYLIPVIGLLHATVSDYIEVTGDSATSMSNFHVCILPFGLGPTGEVSTDPHVYSAPRSTPKPSIKLDVGLTREEILMKRRMDLVRRDQVGVESMVRLPIAAPPRT